MHRTLRSIAAVSTAMLLLAPVAGASVTNSGRFDVPRSGFAPPSTVLRTGSAESVGLDPAPLNTAFEQLQRWTNTAPGRAHPMYAGAVGLLAHDGTVVRHEASGYQVRYADRQGTELPASEREPASTDTAFDIASVTKLFTSMAVLQEVDRGQVELDAPVADYLPGFGQNGKERITVRQLLTHTSGLQAEVQLWELPPHQRVPALLRLRPEHEPGTQYTYSDPNMMTLGLLLEKITGQPLNHVVSERITGPLGMSDTGYRPTDGRTAPGEPEVPRDRIAATEVQVDPSRGLVHGEVHDENAWSLGGVSGHAGIFSTAHDLAVLGQSVLNGGTYAGQRVLSPRSTRLMLTNFNSGFPGNSHGLGFELNQRFYMAGLSGPRTAGHTGFTGTSLVLDPDSSSLAVLLTNRVHPSRDWGSNNPAREALAQGLAESLAVRPRYGDDSWFTNHAGTLRTGSIGPASGPIDIRFDAFLDTQNDPDGTDPLLVEYTTDGQHWKRIPVSAKGRGAPAGNHTELAGSGHRGWWSVHGRIHPEPGQQLQLRWRYAPDEQYTGRGVHVDGLRVTDGSRVLLDGEREPDRVEVHGWRAVSR